MWKSGDKDLAPFDSDLERTLNKLGRTRKNELNLSNNQWRTLKVVKKEKR